jgi:hypothetical protein
MSQGAFSGMPFHPILETPEDIPHVVLDVPIVKSQHVQSEIAQTRTLSGLGHNETWLGL